MLGCLSRVKAAVSVHSRAKARPSIQKRWKHNLRNPRPGRPILAIESSCDDTGMSQKVLTRSEYGGRRPSTGVTFFAKKFDFFALHFAFFASKLSQSSTNLAFVLFSRCNRNLRPKGAWRSDFETRRNSHALARTYPPLSGSNPSHRLTVSIF